MAGRGHHFIPQLLQKGFSAGQTKKGKHQVWVFRRNQKPFCTSTENSFVVRDFYGPPSDALVDKLITDEEQKLDLFLTESRSVRGIVTIGPSELATDLVLQISIRVRWVRKIAETASRAIVERVAAALKGPSGIPKLLVKQSPGWLYTGLVREFESRFRRTPSAEEQSHLARIASELESNPQRMAEMIDPSPMLRALQDLERTLNVAAERGHLQGIDSSLRLRDTNLRQFLRTMNWSIVNTGPHTLVLGDCGPLHMDMTATPLGPMGIPNREQVRGIALPISSCQVLVGRLDTAGANPEAGSLNGAAAAWSHEAFIASQDSEENRRLLTVIDSKVGPFVQETLGGLDLP